MNNETRITIISSIINRGRLAFVWRIRRSISAIEKNNDVFFKEITMFHDFLDDIIQYLSI